MQAVLSLVLLRSSPQHTHTHTDRQMSAVSLFSSLDSALWMLTVMLNRREEYS